MFRVQNVLPIYTLTTSLMKFSTCASIVSLGQIVQNRNKIHLVDNSGSLKYRRKCLLVVSVLRHHSSNERAVVDRFVLCDFFTARSFHCLNRKKITWIEIIYLFNCPFQKYINPNEIICYEKWRNNKELFH